MYIKMPRVLTVLLGDYKRSEQYCHFSSCEFRSRFHGHHLVCCMDRTIIMKVIWISGNTCQGEQISRTKHKY